MSKTKIIVCAHKDSLVPNKEPYMPIQVGKALSDKDLGYIGDNTGDNISEKNPHYCEMTALYWAWKNLPSDVDYVGMCHYRRYFWFNPDRNFIQADKMIDESQFDHFIDQTPTDMGKYLGKYDVIMNRPWYYHNSIEDVSMTIISVEDQVILHKAILKLHPEYSYSLQKYLRQTNNISHCNMFITSREIFDAYCEWIFSILFEVEKHLKLGSYVNQRRVFAYMSEMLMRLFYLHNNYKIKYLPYVFIDTTVQTGRTDIIEPSNLRYIFDKSRKNLSFWIGRKSLLRPKRPFGINTFIEANLKNLDKIEF